MADKKISALPAATTPLAGTEVLPVVQGGTTEQVSVANLTVGRDVVANSYQVSNRLKLNSTWIADAVAPTGNDTGLAFSTRIYPCDSAGNLTNNTLSLGSSLYQFSSIHTGDNVVIGTAGKGIDFSANTHAAGMTSELLDWYEEGTWTPTDASGAGLSFVAVSGNYTRIGNTVFLFGYVRYPVTATTNTARIGGLPFTANSADSVAQGAVTYSQVATIRSVGVAKSTAILDVYTLAGGVPTNADLSNTVLYFNSTYFV